MPLVITAVEMELLTHQSIKVALNCNQPCSTTECKQMVLCVVTNTCIQMQVDQFITQQFNQ